MQLAREVIKFLPATLTFAAGRSRQLIERKIKEHKKKNPGRMEWTDERVNVINLTKIAQSLRDDDVYSPR